MKIIAIIIFLSVLNFLLLLMFLEETTLGNAIQDKIIEKIKGEENE